MLKLFQESASNNLPSLVFLTEGRSNDALTAQSHALDIGLSPYGRDSVSEVVKAELIEACGYQDGDVYFFVTGTAANSFALLPFCKPYSRVICSRSSHLWTLEAGCSANILDVRLDPIATESGKLNSSCIERARRDYVTANPEQHLPISAVSISNSTESGGFYSLTELTELSNYCRNSNLALVVDGARLPYALAAARYSLQQFSSLVDAFTLSNTKVGGDLGAVVVLSRKAPNWYRRAIKAHGHLVDSNWFIALHTRNTLLSEAGPSLHFRCISLAAILAQKLESYGMEIFYAGTNLVFVRLDWERRQVLSRYYETYLYSLPIDVLAAESNHWTRFVVGPGTSEQDIEALLSLFPL